MDNPYSMRHRPEFLLNYSGTIDIIKYSYGGAIHFDLIYARVDNNTLKINGTLNFRSTLDVMSIVVD